MKRLARNYEKLIELLHANPSRRKIILENAENDLLICLSDIAFNI